MNNQKLSKINANEQEIAALKKQVNYQKFQIEAARDDYRDLLKKYNEIYSEKITLLEELSKIKSHWLYKLINWFK